MFDIIAIGSATRDAFFEADFPTVNWPKTPSRKAYLLPKGEKLEVKKVFFTIGGNAVNAGVTFARQGFKAAVAGKTGRDVSGEEIRRRLQKEKINTGLISSTPDLPTAYSVLLLEKGERTILGYNGASNSFEFSDLHLEKMHAKWWYVSLAGESRRMFKNLLKFSDKNNIAVAFNPSGYHLKHGRNEILSSLKNLSFLVLNDEEAATLTGIPWRREKEVFRKLDKFTPGILAVTSGRGGATVSDGKYVYKAGIFREKKLADRTGAGDAFGAGFVAGLMRKGVGARNIHKVRPADICYAMRLATANATAVIEKIGATEGVLTRREFASPRWKNLKISVTKI
jgi:sugar/nucleoside kinase (ribokinase family)